jgi:hypothetical protein
MLNKDDEDVKIERARIEGGRNNRDVIVVNNLTKVFSRNSYHAVNHLSFGIPHGECFGYAQVLRVEKMLIFCCADFWV